MNSGFKTEIIKSLNILIIVVSLYLQIHRLLFNIRFIKKKRFFYDIFFFINENKNKMQIYFFLKKKLLSEKVSKI
jgi:hypothetical protein